MSSSKEGESCKDVRAKIPFCFVVGAFVDDGVTTYSWLASNRACLSSKDERTIINVKDTYWHESAQW